MKISAQDVVQAQLEYYNNHDIAGFISTYSENIKIFNAGELKPFINGRKELREVYIKRFELPNLHAIVVNRMVLGDFVIDHEHVKGIKENEVIQAIATYEVKNGLIENVWFIKE